MITKFLSGCLLLSMLALSACSIGLRKDIFHNSPTWEDQALLELVPTSKVNATEDNAALINKKSSPCLETSYGLGSLAKQVLQKTGCFNVSSTEHSLTTTSDVFLAKEETPIPDELAKSPVTKAIVQTIYKEYQKLLSASTDMPLVKSTESEDVLSNDTLSTKDFETFGDLLAKQFWLPLQHARLGEAHPFISKKTEEGKLTWLDIFTFYLMDYYNGNYVDRFGVKYEKSELDFKINNNAVVGLANIFQDSLWDYALLGLYKDIKTPVVFKTNTPGTFYNTSGKVPTFAKLLRANRKKPDAIEGLVEPERSGAWKKGLNQSEVCVVHYFSGLSGEASEALSGMIVRTLGGSNLGFVVAYGKISIGDNQLLTKLIDASVETFSKRSAAALFSTIFYQSDKTTLKWTGGSKAGQWLEKHIKIADLLTCFEKKE